MPEQVSVVITNYNGQAELPETLESIRKIDYPLAEVIVVDDGSKDRSVEVAQKVFPGVRIIALGKNTARLNVVRNAGLRGAVSNLVFLMDNDILVDPGCVPELVRAHAAYPDAAICSPRLLYATDRSKIYTDGQSFHYLCQSIARNRNGPSAAAPELMKATTGGGILLIDKAKAAQVDFFGEDFRLGWGDDGEFYHRVRMIGYETYHVPQAVCYHYPKERTTQRAYAQVYNRWLIILETYALRSLVVLAPALLLYELFLCAMLSMKGAAGDYFRANAELVRDWPKIAPRRKRIQAARKRSDRERFSAGGMYVSESLLNNWIFRTGLKAVNAIFIGYWKIAEKLI